MAQQTSSIVARVLDRFRRLGVGGLAVAALALLLPERHQALHRDAAPAPFQVTVDGAGHPGQPPHAESAHEVAPAPCDSCLVQAKSSGRSPSPPVVAELTAARFISPRPENSRRATASRTLASPRAPPDAA